MSFICRTYCIIFALLSISFTSITHAAEQESWRSKIDVKIVYPSADKLKPDAKTPNILDVYQQDKLVGYVIVNTDFADGTGYSGKPIHLAIGFDSTGVIKGFQMLKHSEPIVLVGIPIEKLMAPFKKYIGYNVLTGYKQKTLEDRKIDIVSGATVTVIVINDSIIKSVIKAFQRLSMIDKVVATETRQLKTDIPDQKLSWQQLLDKKLVTNMHFTIGEVSKHFANEGFIEASKRPESNQPNDTFIDMYATIASIDNIGKNLLGEGEYQNMKNRLAKNQQAIILAANGAFSFRGTGFVRGGVFDRIQIEQGENIFRFRDKDYKRIAKFYDGAPDFTEIGLYYMTSEDKFDPTLPFTVKLLISREIAATDKSFYNVKLNYALPDNYFTVKAIPISKTDDSIANNNRATSNNLAANTSESSDRKAQAQKLTNMIWLGKTSDIIILITALSILTIIFFFQNQLARHPRLTKVVRYSFLVFTLVWLGWMQNAQLSVVNVFALVGQNFNLQLFLRDPLIFILWCGVAAGLILWARGSYCGWLCPFGALQELLNHIARKLKIPQITLPWGLHERLWALKYIIFLGLLGVSLYSFETAEHLAEIEPFKTSIILKFSRSWPYVAYAVSLLVIGLFIERFFCRYICPLGAGLAIPAKLKLFDWIKRYPHDCGTPCLVCAKECMVDAIHPEGNINANECLNCLHCQVRYFDDQACPVKVKERKKVEHRATWVNPKDSKMPIKTNDNTETKL